MEEINQVSILQPQDQHILLGISTIMHLTFQATNNKILPVISWILFKTLTEICDLKVNQLSLMTIMKGVLEQVACHIKRTEGA